MEDLAPGVTTVAPPGAGRSSMVPARAVSSAVLRVLHGNRRAAPVGAGRGAVHLDLAGFIVTVTGPGVPWMPNGIVVDRLDERPCVGWDPVAPPVWDPVPTPVVGGPEQVAALGRWLSARVDIPEITLDGAPTALLGRGRGLTPEGDDILAGAAVGLRALGPAAGLTSDTVDGMARALCPVDVRARTGSLSATLLELAAVGAAPEPVTRLLADEDREGALSDLRRLGASTGAAIAAGIGLAAIRLGRVRSSPIV